MKKLSSTTKGKIHPSSSPPPPNISDHLSLLPATTLTLAVALPPQDRQVLAYLISFSGYLSNNFSGHHIGRPKRNQPPEFECSCFGCYMSYWVRWDSSPNREIIHEILDAYEDGLLQKKKNYYYNNVKNRKERRKRNSNSNSSSVDTERKGEKKLVEVSFQGDVEEMRGEEEIEKSGSSVRKIVRFLGERVWGVWGI